MVNRKDVAKKANVSVTAVSRVLNNSGYVSKEKRDIIIKAAKELGYTPNPVAVSLKQNKTKQILFHMQNTSNSYYMELYAGMLVSAADKGYLVLISGSTKLEKIASLMIDGVVFSATSFVQEDMKKKLHVPYVIASHGDFISPEIHTVVTDTGEAVQQAIQYLRENGHEKIAFATFDAPINNPRIMSYQNALGSVLGNQADNYFLSVSTALSGGTSIDLFDIGVQAAQAFAQRKLDATAVVCYNDDIAIGFNHQVQKLGYRVPEDVSIVGIDGILFGRYMVPELTTIDIHPQTRGEKAVEVLIELIEGKEPPVRSYVQQSLREGRSVCRLTK